MERFAAEIDRLNALSGRPNPFLSAAFLLCYALRAEYHIPGEERLYLIREGNGGEGGRIVGIAPLRRSMEWGLLEFAGQLPGTPLYDAMHTTTNGTFRARDFQVEPYTGHYWRRDPGR